MKTNFYIQHRGSDVLVKDIEKQAKEAYKQEGFKASQIDTLDIYYIPSMEETYVAITDKDGKVREIKVEEQGA